MEAAWLLEESKRLLELPKFQETLAAEAGTSVQD
jgi:hypothetical protein